MASDARLYLLEGPDCSGKTTLARALSEATGARYVHHGPYAGLSDVSLAHVYAVSMLHPMLGVGPAVLDRCWLSEVPYGKTYRGGEDRVGDRRANLDAMAGLCDPVRVMCLPRWEDCRRLFAARKGANPSVEYLDNLDQLWSVYLWYEMESLSPGWLVVDPFRLTTDETVRIVVGHGRERE